MSALPVSSSCCRLTSPSLSPSAVLERFLNSLLQQQEFAAAAAAGSQQAAAGRQRQDLAWMAPLLCVLLQSPLNGEPSIGGKLLTRICRIVAVTLPAQERLPVRRAAQAMLSRLPADVLAARCVRPVLRFIEGCVQTGLGATRVQARAGGSCAACLPGVQLRARATPRRRRAVPRAHSSPALPPCCRLLPPRC